MMLKIRSLTWSVIFTVALASAVNQLRAAGAENSEDKQRRLINVLQSQAPPQEKAIACKQLAVCGTKDAVPALAPLLLDPELASWARIALEVIPDPAADDALRQALDKAQGRLLVGVINSIGVRHDPKAVSTLAQKLKDADVEIASAAAEALGHIGGQPAAQALAQSLNRARGDFSRVEIGLHSAVAYGCILCAEKFLAAGQTAEAVRLYDSVRQANVPKQEIIEATRGAILARKAGGLPLLLEQLKSPDKAMLGIGLRTARELLGSAVTEALAAELEQFNSERQALLLLVLADRGDAAALPIVTKLAKNGPNPVRIAALGALEQLDKVACLPVLLSAATEDDAELVRAAKAGLARLAGKEADAEILALLSPAAGKMRRLLIELAGQRRIHDALPIVARSVEDPDAGIRSAAVRAVGALGDEKQAGDLVALLPKAQTAEERDDLEKALLAIITRRKTACLPYLLPLAQSGDSALRKIALHTLSSVGGSEALAVVKTALDDPDESVRDEAVRALSAWASNWPDDSGVAEPLLMLAKSGKKASYQVQGLRGYMQYVQEDKKLNDEEKVTKVSELLPLIQRPEEKRLAVAVISAIPTTSALELLATLATDPAIAEESYLAMVKLAGAKDLKNVSKELRQRLLETVVAKSKSDSTRSRAEETLKRLRF